MKRNWFAFGLAFLVVTAAAVGVAGYFGGQEPAEAAQLAAEVLPVEEFLPTELPLAETEVFAGAEVFPGKILVTACDPDGPVWEAAGWKFSDEDVDTFQPLPEKNTFYFSPEHVETCNGWLAEGAPGSTVPTGGVVNDGYIEVWVVDADGNMVVNRYPPLPEE